MATINLFKEKALAEDLDTGMGNGTGSRQGSQINATNIPYSGSASIAEQIDTKINQGDGDARYAMKEGNATVEFKVETPSGEDGATPKSYVDAGLDARPLTTQVTAALETKAEKAGSSSQAFNVASPAYPDTPNPSETVNFSYLSDWFDGNIQPQIDDKADKATTLDTVVEHDPYDPTLPMHPATKAYVDQKVVDIGAGDMTEAEYVNDSSASKAVYSTKNVGNFGSALGITPADEVMRVSQNTLTDINNISGMGIHIGPVDGMSGDLPPASAGTNIAVEQLEIIGSPAIAQRATTDKGFFFRATDGSSFTQGGSISAWSTWTRTTTDADVANYTYSKAEVDSQQAAQNSRIDTNEADIATNASNIATNASNISSNTNAISTNTSDIATNASNISSNTSAINTKIGASDYASADGTVGGTCKARLSGTTMYITFNGSDA